MRLKAEVIRQFSLTIAVMICLISVPGLSVPDVYARETPNWYAQAVAQDGFDLFIIVPALLIAAFLSNTSKIAFLLWGGVLAYCVYTFIIYCFALHFNMLFPLYCITLGTASFALLYFLAVVITVPVTVVVKGQWALKVAAYYLMAVSLMFYLLWLMSVVPAAINNSPPQELADTGLLTNPIHVLDLSVCLPALFLTGALAINGNKSALLLIPAALSFCILMNLTIGTISVVMNMNGIASNPYLPAVMVAMSFVCTSLLVWYVRKIEGFSPRTADY